MLIFISNNFRLVYEIVVDSSFDGLKKFSVCIKSSFFSHTNKIKFFEVFARFDYF